MPFSPGSAVKLNTSRTSVAGGSSTQFAEGSVGRVCKVSESGSGFCCVQFSNRCLRVHEDFLSPTSERAPPCVERCASGC